MLPFLSWKTQRTLLLRTCLLVAVSIFSGQSTASTSLYSTIIPASVTSPPPQVNAIYSVDLNFDGLKTNPSVLSITLPDGETIAVQRMLFEPRAGYLFADDEDPPNTPPFWPDPNATDDSFSFYWAGSSTVADVVITAINGKIMAYINANSKRFGIEWNQDAGNYWLTEYNLTSFPVDGTPLNQSYISHKKHHSAIPLPPPSTLIPYGTQNPHSLTSLPQLDVLVVYTEDARVDAGGDPGNPNDTAGIDLLIQASIDHANTALINSNVATRIVNFYSAKVDGYEPTSSWVTALPQFRDLQPIQQLRNLVGADLVVGIVKDYTTLQACGVAFVQSHPGCGFPTGTITCSPGAGFSDNAYALVARFCSLWDDTFTHEVGHLLGANHTRASLGSTVVNEIVANGFPEAFAWVSSDNSIKTIMSIEPTTTTRRLYFSNPNITVDGTAIGIANETNNAGVASFLAPNMSEFRQRPDAIFKHGFETQ